MAKNTINDLRSHLFETIERLKSNSDPEASECEKMNIEDARMIVAASKAIIDTVKTEMQSMKTLSELDVDVRSKFMSNRNNSLGISENGTK